MHPQAPSSSLGHRLGWDGLGLCPQGSESALCDMKPLDHKPSLPLSATLPLSTSVIACGLTNPPRDVWVIRRFFIY